MRHAALIILIECSLLISTAAWAAGQPSGEGDPTATTCMRLQARTGSILVPPRLCKTNAEWKQLKEKKLVLTPDGTQAIATDDPRNIGAQVCQRAAPVATMGVARPGADAPMNMNYNMTCNY